MPPQLPEYHFHEAPVPKEPPDTVNVHELPEQIGFGLAVILDGLVDIVPVVYVTSKIGGLIELS